MEPTLMVPPNHTLYEELDHLLADSDTRYPIIPEHREEGSDEDAYDSQILAGLVLP
jgi:hypothetical protein